jgi:adenylate cyclase
VGPTRIGVHAGPAIVGNFGGSRFFDYTAYGDTINIAARLEAANKQLGTRVCASEAIIKGASDVRGRPIGDLMLRGRHEPLKAFEPLTQEEYEATWTQNYLKAFALLEAGDPSAIAEFARVVAERPDDPLAGFHLRRLLNGAANVRIAMD